MRPQRCPHRHLDNVDATMSILDVSMLTGFSPDLQDLKRVSMGTHVGTWGQGEGTQRPAVVCHRALVSPCPRIPLCC